MSILPRVGGHALSTLAAVLAGTLVTTPSGAVSTEVAVYHFGDVDAGAADGENIHNPTVDLVRGRHLSPIGEVRYTADTPNPDNPFAAELGPGAYFSTHDLPTTQVVEFAIEVWVKPTALAGFQWIVYDGAPNQNGYGIARVDDRYWGFFGDQGGLLGGLVVPGEWTQLAISHHFGKLSIRTNGVVWGSFLGPAPVAPQPGLDSAFSIGAGAGGVSPFEGLIDEVRVMVDPSAGGFDFNLDGSGFRDVEPPGRVRYHLGEADPGAAAGAVGNDPTVDSAGSLPLPRLGAPKYSGEVVNPSFPLAMGFDGSGERYRTGTLPSTAPANWGVEAWVKSDTAAGFSWIVYNGRPGIDGWGLAHAAGNWTGYLGPSAFYGGPVLPGRWTHLALVNTGEFTHMYNSGVRLEANNSIYTPPSPGPNSGFSIGAGPTGAGGFAGAVDEVRVFEFAPGTFDPLDPAPHLNLRAIGSVPLDPPLFQDGFEGGNLLRWSAWLGWSP